MTKTTEPISKKEALKLINEAYYRLDCLNNISWEHYRDRLFDMHKDYEKQHDRGRPDGISRGISITDSAKLFTVVWLAEFMQGRKAPEAKEYLFVRKSLYYAYALYANYGKEITEAWKGLDVAKIASLDYAELQKV